LVEIASGLQEHEQVVVDDPAILTDGMKVQLRSGAAAAQVAGRLP
jgi:hypothetical protein